MNTLWNKIKSFRPPLILSCIMALLFSTAALVSVATDFGEILPAVAIYGVYVCAAIFLSLAIWAIVIFCMKAPPGKRLNELAHRLDFTGRLVDNYSFRTITFTYGSFALNVIFALAKGVAGWFSASWWLITFAAYYLLLCVVRFFLLRDSRKLNKLQDQAKRLLHEWKAYRMCGVSLLFMTLVLFGVVILIMQTDSHFTYFGTLIFTVALWDFYCLITAIIYMVRNRRQHSPIIVAVKMLNFATALVSMLSLQTAMFASFGGDSATSFKRWMNLATGSAVCLMVFGIGLAMVIRSNRQMKMIAQTEVTQ